VAQSVAALGEAATPARVSTLMTADPDEVARAWRLLELTGLTAKHAFRHPATAAAVLGELRKPERAGLHQRAARLLHTEGAEPAEVAARLLAADRAIDPWMVSVLLDGSDQFLSRDDVPRAIECLKLAHRGCTDDRQRAAIRSQLVRAEGRADPVAAGRHLPDMVTALQHNQLPPRHLITLIRQLVWTGKPDDALGALNLLISTADPADAELATEIRIIRLWLSCWQPRLAARIPGKQAPPVSGPATRVDLRLRAIEALAAALQRPGSEGTVSEAEQVLQCLHLRENTVEPALYALLALLYADQGALALPWCTRLMADAAERKAPAWQANFTSIRSEIAMSQGEPALAEEYATAALELVGPREWGAAIGGPMATLMLASTMMGKDAAVAELLHRPVPDQLFETRFGLRYLHARGRHYLATARPRAALADFLACGDLAAEWGLDVSATSPWPTDAAEVLIQLEEPDEARKLLERQLDILGEHRTRSRGMALRVLAQAGGPAGRRSLLTESVELLEAAGDAVELARALADLGDACRAAGDVDEGRKLARRSWRLAKAAKVLASARTAHLGPVPQKPPGGREPVALSDAERRVAELITAGYTNREIARQLFITVSTVEQHVTRIYRKLAVKRRDELAARYQEYLAWTAESA